VIQAYITLLPLESVENSNNKSDKIAEKLTLAYCVFKYNNYTQFKSEIEISFSWFTNNKTEDSNLLVCLALLLL